jgi:hypothetical protein
VLLTASSVRGDLRLAENQLPAALEDASTAVSLAKQLQGGVQRSSRVGQALLLQARVYERMGDTTHAQQAAESAFQHLSATVDENHPALMEARTLAGRQT